MQTKDPTVTLTYVGPLWPQSKQNLFWGRAANSLRVFKLSSSCFLREEAIAHHLLQPNLIFLFGKRKRDPTTKPTERDSTKVENKLSRTPELPNDQALGTQTNNERNE